MSILVCILENCEWTQIHHRPRLLSVASNHRYYAAKC